MPRALVNGLEIEYESFGEPASNAAAAGDGPLVPDDRVGRRALRADRDRGFRVTRFDNRDSGLSSKLDQLGPPDLMGLLTHTAAPPYTLDDMAGDAVGVLDAMGVGARTSSALRWAA